MLRFFLLRVTEMDPSQDRNIFGFFLLYFARLALPILVTALVAALLSNIVQVGFLFTWKPLEFKFNRVIPNFSQYFSKTLFSANGMFNLAKSLVKMFIAGWTAYLLIRGDIEKIANLSHSDLMLAFKLIAGLAVRLLIIMSLFLLVLAIPDYLFQRWQHQESLKITRYESKQEHKEAEGDPQVKARLRKRMRELLRQNIAQNVPKADVVITNPTHFAVALEYNRSLYAPRVTAKGDDDLALRIKRIALEHAVPVVENKPLARALYAAVDVGDVVPEQFWMPVVEILKRVKSADEYRKMAGW
jgi:flagellar biosynthetic protein FlhB